MLQKWTFDNRVLPFLDLCQYSIAGFKRIVSLINKRLSLSPGSEVGGPGSVFRGRGPGIRAGGLEVEAQQAPRILVSYNPCTLYFLLTTSLQ